MNDDFDGIIETRARWYANFAGILIGFSITIAVLIVTQANEGITKLPQYGYSLAAFIYSALAFFSTYTWYGRATERIGATEDSESIKLARKKKRDAFMIGSIFYYTGYWSVLLGLIYLTTLIQLQTLNYPFFIPFVFLLYTFVINLKESLWEILKGEKLNGFILLVLLFVFIYISYKTIPLDPFFGFL